MLQLRLRLRLRRRLRLCMLCIKHLRRCGCDVKRPCDKVRHELPVHTGRVLLPGESAAVSGFGCRVVVRVGRWVWMVVRFVCVLRVSACALVCPVCVPAPPGVFYRFKDTDRGAGRHTVISRNLNRGHTVIPILGSRLGNYGRAASVALHSGVGRT